MKKIGLLVLLTVFVSCQYNPFAHLYLMEKPTSAGVVGTYILKRQTMDRDLKFENKPRIVFRKDGSYRAYNFPVFKSDNLLDYKFSRQLSFSGKWSIDSFGVVDSGFSRDPNYGIYLENAPESAKYLELTGEEKPDGFAIVYGDPDSGNGVVFTKI
ncbi:hypothetical protein [Flavobacterium sp.]|uniref:hypothetical protein n=1 Tax=Flavobacterium sp. TaxID=239 RepID=UPI0011FEDEC4|nr:hypothetical protein [Flavobacterium sp.]RZJ72234.1 MAG: hypothetical protein EOO49_07220 [Flavobacterium sp.]